MERTTRIYRATDDTDRIVRTFWTADPRSALIWSRDGGRCPVIVATVPMGGDWEPRFQGFAEYADEYFTTMEADEVMVDHPDADIIGGWDVHEGDRNRCFLVATEYGAGQVADRETLTHDEFVTMLENEGVI